MKSSHSLAILAIVAGCNNSSSATVVEAGAPATSSSAVVLAASAAPSASAAPDPDACGPNNTPPTFKYADVPFTWSKTPSLADVPKDRSYAFVGEGKPFELTKVAIWVTKSSGEFSVRTNDGELLGPSLTFTGPARTGYSSVQKWGSHSGYFQVPIKKMPPECFKQTLSANSDYAASVKLTRYDGKTADGSFITTWERHGEQRLWAAGTFKDAEVLIF